MTMTINPIPHNTFIVGLAGVHGAGKDSCAVVLARHGYRSIAFADALRREIVQAFHVDERLLTNRETKEVQTYSLSVCMCLDPFFVRLMHSAGVSLSEPRSPRWVMQQWGTEYRRAAVPDYWEVEVMNWILKQRGIGWTHFVVTDVLFPNQVAMLRHMGAKLLCVHRPDGVARLAPDTEMHSSRSVPLVLFDGDIVNDGTLVGLPEKVEREVLRVMGAGGLRLGGAYGQAQAPSAHLNLGAM